MARFLFGWLIAALTVAVPAIPAVAATPANAYIVLCYHDIPENGRKLPPFDRMAVARRNFEEHIDWLSQNGYHFISVQQVIDAHRGRIGLPDKAVLLTFDDGFESFYTRVFPILKARHIPAVEAVIGTWMQRTEKPDVPGDKPVLTWPEVHKVLASGLVEIASHTDDMHQEILADPEREQHAAVTTRQYLPKLARYESDAEYSARLRTGMQKSSDFIFAATGRRPRVLVWPFGEYNSLAVAEARHAGMPVTLALSDGLNDGTRDVSVINRVLVTDDPEVPAFAAAMTSLHAYRAQRAIRVDLDGIADRDPVRQNSNITALVARVKSSGATSVYLQAYADQHHDGSTEALYFPNRHLPVRADIFGAVTERLQEAAGTRVYAVMPTRVVDAPSAFAMQRWLGDIYEDLAKYAAIDGVVFSSRESLAYPSAASRLHGHGRGISLASAHSVLAARARTYRPMIMTALEVNSPSIRQPRARQRFDRLLPGFLRQFDYVAVYIAQVKGQSDQLAQLVSNVNQSVAGPRRIIFEQDLTNRHPRGSALAVIR